MNDMESLIKSLREELNKKDEHIAILLEVIRLQHLRSYASRSEKNKTPDGDIFNADDQEPESNEPQETITVGEHQRIKPKRKKLPDNLPRVYIEIDMPEEAKICPCGCALTHIGDVKSEQYDIIPEVVQVLCYVRKKYACRNCSETIKTAPMPIQPIPKSNASPGFLAHVMVSKYCDHLPLYRQEQHLQYDIGFADETPVQVLKEEGRKPESKSYMWVFAGGSPDKFSCAWRMPDAISARSPSYRKSRGAFQMRYLLRLGNYIKLKKCSKKVKPQLI